MNLRLASHTLRCQKCHYRSNDSMPPFCPICRCEKFELHRPFEVSRLKLTLVLLIVGGYILISRTIFTVYDPLWLAISGFLEGYVSAGIMGTFITVVLGAGAFAWIIYPRAATLGISALSIGAWIVCCIYMRAIVFA